MFAFLRDESEFVEVLEIAKPRLPLTRELSSEARLRERKGCGFMRFYFSPSDFLLTQKATSQLPFRSVLLSLRLEIATGNPHPRQREARVLVTDSSRGRQGSFLCLARYKKRRLYLAVFFALRSVVFNFVIFFINQIANKHKLIPLVFKAF